MQERELADKLYQQWSKTDDPQDPEWCQMIFDAFPQIVRQYNTALDEADRADFDKDSRECRIAELEVALAEELANVAHLQAQVVELEADLEGLIAR